MACKLSEPWVAGAFINSSTQQRTYSTLRLAPHSGRVFAYIRIPPSSLIDNDHVNHWSLDIFTRYSLQGKQYSSVCKHPACTVTYIQTMCLVSSLVFHILIWKSNLQSLLRRCVSVWGLQLIFLMPYPLILTHLDCQMILLIMILLRL